MDCGRQHLLSTGQRTKSMFPRRKSADWRSIDPSATRAYLICSAVQFRIRIRLHPAAVESATCLQASRFSDAGRLTRHVLETSTEILHHLRPCRTVDTKSIEYRRGISRRRTSFASHGVARQPIQDRQVVRFGHCQKALVAATLLALTRPRP